MSKKKKGKRTEVNSNLISFFKVVLKSKGILPALKTFNLPFPPLPPKHTYPSPLDPALGPSSAELVSLPALTRQSSTACIYGYTAWLESTLTGLLWGQTQEWSRHWHGDSRRAGKGPLC